MKISPICAKGYSYKSSHASLKRNANEIKNKPIQNSPSFKSIYVDYVADIGLAKEGMYPARFKPQDSLALNEISYLRRICRPSPSGIQRKTHAGSVV